MFGVLLFHLPDIAGAGEEGKEVEDLCGLSGGDSPPNLLTDGPSPSSSYWRIKQFCAEDVPSYYGSI